MSIAGKSRIKELLQSPNIQDRLIVTPLLDEDQIGESSIDLRLGNDFVTARNSNLEVIDPGQANVHENRYHVRRHIKFGDRFYLHPGEFVLASTLEYFRLPINIAGNVTSRSSWGRMGLVIATATAVHSGFTGTITLELVNHGHLPLALYPGMRYTQIVLFEAVGAGEYKGRFTGQVGATDGKIAEDKRNDLEFWTKPEHHGR